MPSSAELLESHPAKWNVDQEALAAAIAACLECTNTCTVCADSCLGAAGTGMSKCIRLCLDCADVCHTTSRVLGRQTEADPAVLREIALACTAACRACADECETHTAGPEGCGACSTTCSLCAEMCRKCENACTQLASSIA